MIGRLHGLQSRVVDSSAFFGIGLWQLLGRAGKHGREEWDRYAEEWLKRGGDEFYKVPEKILGDLKEGRASFPSPVTGDREENNRFHLRVWPGSKGLKSPAMVMLHSLFSVSYTHLTLPTNREV